MFSVMIKMDVFSLLREICQNSEVHSFLVYEVSSSINGRIVDDGGGSLFLGKLFSHAREFPTHK